MKGGGRGRRTVGLDYLEDGIVDLEVKGGGDWIENELLKFITE